MTLYFSVAMIVSIISYVVLHRIMRGEMRVEKLNADQTMVVLVFSVLIGVAWPLTLPVALIYTVGTVLLLIIDGVLK